MTLTLKPALLSLLGTVIHGDLGPYTFYTSKRRGKVFYLKAPPAKPPSRLQHLQRNKIRDAAASWRRLTPQSRALWNLAAKRAHLRIGGYQLWVAQRLTTDSTWLRTIERQCKIQLPS